MAFLGIKIPFDLAQLLHKIEVPGVKEPLENLHITLLHFTTSALPVAEVGKMIEIAYDVISDMNPFSIEFGVIDSFPKGDKDYPIILPITSKDLAKMHSNLKKEFDKAKLDFSKKFKTFRPHITLSYSETPVKKKKIETLSFTVTEVTLWAGGREEEGVEVKIPLKMESLAYIEMIQLNKMAEKLEFLTLFS